MEVNRPSQKSQTSRKGKKAWRKNIDIDDVQAGLERNREDYIAHGSKLSEVSSADLFTVDVSGDAKIAHKISKNTKVLKATEILNKRSKAPALVELRNNKKSLQGVSGKEIHRLMKLAGRVQGASQTDAIVEKEGIMRYESYDVWGDDGPLTAAAVKARKIALATPSILKERSISGHTKASKVPSTLLEAPIKIKAYETIPSAGKSYNPSLDSWKLLINEEYAKEKTKEDARLALEAHKQKIQELINQLDNNEEDDSGAEQDAGEEEDAEDATELTRLSVNKPTEKKIKTRAQRNKEERFKERTELESKLKSLKHQIKELEKLPEFLDEISAKIEKTAATVAKNSDPAFKKHKLFKYASVDDPLEVKLSDELTDSLRLLKPEGNLLYDQMRKMQNSGKVEARKQVSKKRRYAPKITEKWTYKDFK
ncbi:hypothetical protein BABINDRAFT_163153 [Babjeviella inositovora NRRL Y-12698]|uniref:Ribosome biogenesis protein NOP53 n=1 Tax=Babjeviella inositovora NRRL Y-12698 TaxID=984486 RepID=A0A1E3QJ78_9ASCO|nr:uncharacterized protein BABINDRAFT_163153 [Babjeviella inositovora NRRL Y-12698]ODQ77755.1 hypothetical protein BABINDRAFT_163153 [Babjeviella inositovora NRRL Y-12698]